MLYVLEKARRSSKRIQREAACQNCRTILNFHVLCWTGGSFAVRSTSMARRGTSNLLVELRTRVSRPGALELEHAHRLSFRTRACRV